jgi:hypothetical protein
MPLDLEALKAEFASRTIDIDGTTFTPSLFDVIQPKPYQTQQMRVRFIATGAGTQHQGELGLGVDNYTNAEIADLAVHTIKEIAAGRLPPDVRSPL